MSDLLNLSNLLAGAKVPKSVIGIQYITSDPIPHFQVQLREPKFREMFTNFICDSFDSADWPYQLVAVFGGVKFIALTDLEPGSN